MPGRSALVLAFLNFGPTEIVIILVVAIVIFGARLPEVAGQAAGAMQRMRRSLEDLRRETGIDREIREARRAMEDAVPREIPTLDLRRRTREGLDKALRAAEIGPGDLPAIPPAKRDVNLPAASGEGETARASGPEAAPPAAPPLPPASTPPPVPQVPGQPSG